MSIVISLFPRIYKRALVKQCCLLLLPTFTTIYEAVYAYLPLAEAFHVKGRKHDGSGIDDALGMQDTAAGTGEELGLWLYSVLDQK